MKELTVYEKKVLNDTKKFFLKEVHSKKETKINKFLSNVPFDFKDKFIVKETITQLWKFLFDCGEFITSEKKVLRKANVYSIDQIKFFELEKCDELNRKLQIGQQTMHFSHGAITGVFGFPGIFVDIATGPSLKNKSLLEQGMSYGFNKIETQLNYTFALLQQNTNSVKDKAIIYHFMKKTQREILNKATTEGIENITEIIIQAFCKNEKLATYLISLAEEMGIKLSSKIVGKFIPIIGAAVGGVISLKDFNNFRDYSQNQLRLAWLQRNGRITESEYENILLGNLT